MAEKSETYSSSNLGLVKISYFLFGNIADFLWIHNEFKRSVQPMIHTNFECRNGKESVESTVCSPLQVNDVIQQVRTQTGRHITDQWHVGVRISCVPISDNIFSQGLKYTDTKKKLCTWFEGTISYFILSDFSYLSDNFRRTARVCHWVRWW